MKKSTATETTATETTDIIIRTQVSEIANAHPEIFSEIATEPLKESTTYLFRLSSATGTISKMYCVAYANIRRDIAEDEKATAKFKTFDGFVEALAKSDSNAPKRSQANLFAQIGERFINPVTGLSIFSDGVNDFSVSALRELLPLSDDEIRNWLKAGAISLTSSKRDIKALVKKKEDVAETTATEMETTATEMETTATETETTENKTEHKKPDSGLTIDLRDFLLHGFTVTMDDVEHTTDGLGILKDFLVFLKVGTEVTLTVKRIS